VGGGGGGGGGEKVSGSLLRQLEVRLWTHDLNFYQCNGTSMPDLGSNTKGLPSWNAGSIVTYVSSCKSSFFQ